MNYEEPLWGRPWEVPILFLRALLHSAFIQVIQSQALLQGVVEIGAEERGRERFR